METLNFNVFSRGSTREPNYKLRGEKLRLRCHGYTPYVRPDGDGYEVVAPNLNHPAEVDEEKRLRDGMNLRGSRKQRAARAAIPKESIKVVPLTKPAIPEVVGIRLSGGDERAERIAVLEHELRELLGIRSKPRLRNLRNASALHALEEVAESKRLKFESK